MFFSLLRGGLWDKEVIVATRDGLNLSEILQLAQEQSVIGLIASGLEKVVDKNLPKEEVLQIVGQTLQLEQSNTAMNAFIEALFGDLKNRGIKTLLVKGQGIAQCYERPLWRSCGDVDLFMDEENYYKAIAYLSTIAQSVGEETTSSLHLAMQVKQWTVELHGSLRSRIGKRVDEEIDSIQQDTFDKWQVRVWQDGSAEISLPSPDNDVIFVFTHILQHFFKGGIGLRQICDWCRLLWTYSEEIDVLLLESRLRKMGLLTEWKAFAALAVDYLGLPTETMLLYDKSQKWKRKADRILSIIMETGNFGHNRDTSYYQKYPFLVYKTISLMKNTRDSIRHLMVFPKDAARVWFIRLGEGVREVLKRK